MDCCNEWDFNNLDDFGSVDFITELQRNVKGFLDLAFLKIGGFTNVDTGIDNCGQDLYSLVRINPPITKPYTLWSAQKKEWVWEDVEYDGSIPNVPTIYDSGVDITDDCVINHSLGQVMINIPVSAPEASYAFKRVHVYTQENGDFWPKIVDHVLNENESEIHTLMKKSKIQLPAIFLEADTTRVKPAQMGSSALFIEQDIIFNVLAETPAMRNKLAAALVQQHGKKFNLYNTDQEKLTNCSGVQNTGTEWSDLPEWRCANIEYRGAANSFEVISSGLYLNRTRLTFIIFSPRKPKW